MQITHIELVQNKSSVTLPVRFIENFSYGLDHLIFDTVDFGESLEESVYRTALERIYDITHIHTISLHTIDGTIIDINLDWNYLTKGKCRVMDDLNKFIVNLDLSLMP